MASNFEYQIPGSDSFAQTVDPSKLTHYQILGVRQGATENEILKAYRTKARIFHPDKTGNDASEEWMKKINDAKSVLLSEKREDYDEKLADEGQAVIDPAGYLPGGPRLSLQFLQYFNNAKISFEAGFIRNLQNFHVILRRDFAENPKQLPALPFTGQSLIQSATPAACKIQALDSPLNEVLEEMNSILDSPQLSTLVDVQSKKLRDIIKMTKTLGTRQTLPEVDGKVPILNFSNVPDKSLQLFHSFFMVSSDQTVLHRDKMLSDLVKFVPYVALQQPSPEVQTQSTCSDCARKLNFFHKAKHTCYHCKSQFCEDCAPKQVVLLRLQPKRAEAVCSTCLQRFTQQDVEDWTKSSLHLIEIGTVKSAKAAMGCLNVALCLSASSTKPIIRVAQGLFHNGLPELAMPFVATVLEHSKATRELLGAYVLSAQILKSMADDTNDDPEVKWNFLLAAKDSCNLAFEQASCLDSGSIEIPSCSTLKKEVNNSLHLNFQQQEHIRELEVQHLCFQMEDLWQKRECEDLLALVLDEDSAISSSFLPHLENMTVVALENFLAPKNGFLDRMLDADRCALIFFRGLTKILKKRVSDGLVDIEEAAYGSNHDEWLKEAVADVLVSLLTKDPALLFPPDSFKETLRGEHLLSSTVLGDRVELLFPQKHEMIPPFNRNWPELTVTGLNIKGHMKFEKAVISQVDQEEWDAKDAAMSYIDYVPACCHPAEVALCFLNAAMWLLKQLQTNLSSSSKRSLSEVYATKQLIVRCLHNSLAVAYFHLHPGMQLYVSRLCLGTAMQTMQLTESLGTKQDVELVTSLLELTIYNCRFCPIWHFPSVPLSEAVLMNIKTGQFHKDFLIALQDVSRDKWPMTPPELLYQLYENDLRYTCPLEDPDGARVRAMEEMLHKRGWTWNDVANRMKSPLSPRDSDGWLIQQPFLGVPMEFANLKGFSFNLDPDNPSIEIIAIPASNLNGKVGLFSMEDVQTVLQLDETELYPIIFSLDPPNENQRFHPFQQFWYQTEKLQKTPLLHTLFETDYLLKSFSVGAEVSAKPPFSQRPCKEGLTKNLPPHLQEAVKPVAERGNTLSNINRFWIQAEELVYDQNQDGSKLEFRLSDLKMKIYSHPLLPGADGKLQDTENETDPDSPEAKFADDLTAHYNELGIHFPMFARLRELAKLQLLGIFLKGLMDDMKDKANGNGEVSRRLLTEIQQEVYQQHETKISKILRNLSESIGNWPAAIYSDEVSSLTWRLMEELPYHVQSQASYSDVEPYAREALRTKDKNVLREVVDGFMQLCEHRVSRSDLESSVFLWLGIRSSAATDKLRNLICSTLPLPSHEDIQRQLLEFDQQKYHAFQQKVNSITASSPQPDKNPCKWVPAALLKEENTDCVRMCYGGVLIAPDIKSGRVPNFPSHARAVPVQQCGASFQNQSDNSYFQAPSARSVPSGGTYSSGTGGVGISLSSRLTTQRPAKTSSTHKPLLNTFHNVYRSHSGDGRGGATGNGGRVGGGGSGGGRSGGGGLGGGGRRGGGGEGGGGGKSGGGGRGGGGGSGRGGSGRGGSGDGKGGGKGGRRILIAAAAALVVKTTHQDGSNPNQRLQEQRKQARQRPPYWYEQRATILSPNGETIQLPPGSEWNMKTPRVVYGLYSAKTGGLVYVGKTEQPLSKRIQAHVRDIRKGEKSTKLVKFFNSEDHSLEDLRAVVLEKVKLGENLVRREMDYVVKYDTKNSGANMRYPMNLNRYTTAEQAF